MRGHKKKTLDGSGGTSGTTGTHFSIKGLYMPIYYYFPMLLYSYLPYLTILQKHCSTCSTCSSRYKKALYYKGFQGGTRQRKSGTSGTTHRRAAGKRGSARPCRWNKVERKKPRSGTRCGGLVPLRGGLFGFHFRPAVRAEARRLVPAPLIATRRALPQVIDREAVRVAVVLNAYPNA